MCSDIRSPKETPAWFNSCKRPLVLRILGGRIREVRLYTKLDFVLKQNRYLLCFFSNSAFLLCSSSNSSFKSSISAWIRAVFFFMLDEWRCISSFSAFTSVNCSKKQVQLSEHTKQSNHCKSMCLQLYKDFYAIDMTFRCFSSIKFCCSP